MVLCLDVPLLDAPVLFLEVEFSVFTVNKSLDVCVFQSKLHSVRAAVYNKQIILKLLSLTFQDQM